MLGEKKPTEFSQVCIIVNEAIAIYPFSDLKLGAIQNTAQEASSVRLLLFTVHIFLKITFTLIFECPASVNS